MENIKNQTVITCKFLLKHAYIWSELEQSQHYSSSIINLKLLNEEFSRICPERKTVNPLRNHESLKMIHGDLLKEPPRLIDFKWRYIILTRKWFYDNDNNNISFYSANSTIQFSNALNNKYITRYVQ